MTAAIPNQPLYSATVFGKKITAHSQEELDRLVAGAEEDHRLDQAIRDAMKADRRRVQRARLARELGVLS
ncbi:MAG: hypothetical protein AAFY29_22890 [Pseudomonadota bacterium]